jgi:hypothetical protein
MWQPALRRTTARPPEEFLPIPGENSKSSCRLEAAYTCFALLEIKPDQFPLQLTAVGKAAVKIAKTQCFRRGRRPGVVWWAHHKRCQSTVPKPKNSLRHVTLPEFLRAAQAGSVEAPQPVHSTLASKIFDIIEAGHLKATACDVFGKEKLCYLFIGRPSYKKAGKGEAPHWMLPVVFIIKGLANLPIKRIHPLDTGAFASGRLPDYLTTFELDSFDLGSDPADISRVISAFYETTERYMKGENRSLDSIKTQVQIGVRHARIEALIRLFSERSLEEIDDRGRNIEVQVAGDVPLADNLLGVVLPDPYRLESGLERRLKSFGAQVEYYSVYPLNADAHLGGVYEAVEKIMRSGK